MSVRSIAIGTVQAVLLKLVDDGGKVQKVQIEQDSLEGEEADLLEHEMMLPYGYSAHPPKDSDAVVVCPSGDGGQAVVVSAQHREHRPKDLKLHEVCLHMLDTILVYLADDGVLHLGARAATEPAVLGNALKSHLDAHVHPSPFGPTGTPAPLPSSALSQIVKVK